MEPFFSKAAAHKKYSITTISLKGLQNFSKQIFRGTPLDEWWLNNLIEM